MNPPGLIDEPSNQKARRTQNSEQEKEKMQINSPEPIDEPTNLQAGSNQMS